MHAETDFLSYFINFYYSIRDLVVEMIFFIDKNIFYYFIILFSIVDKKKST